MKKNLDMLNSQMVIGFFMIFYAVGVFLFFFEPTRSLFYRTVPFSLIMVTVLIFLFHKGNRVRSAVLFSAIFVFSFLLEYAGIHTGRIFGRYEYLSSLGPKWGEVPLIIGMNWILMVYSSAAIMFRITGNTLLRITGGALSMVLYDLLLEAVAPVMMMWDFYGQYPPLRNFAAWFAAALIFHTLLYAMRIDPENKPARYLFFIQMVFFVFIITIEAIYS